MRYWTQHKEGINEYDYRVYGCGDVEDWLKKIEDITEESREETVKENDFIILCEYKGLIITFKETFLNIYWRNKKNDNTNYKGFKRVRKREV